MFELWISEPWDADPEVLRGCFRPLKKGGLGLFTSETGEYLLQARYVGDSLLSVYSDVPITVNIDQLVSPYAEVWSGIESLPNASDRRECRARGVLKPFGIGTLVLAMGWTTLAFMESYEQTFSSVANSLGLESPRKICRESVLLIYRRRHLAVVVKMNRYDLSISCFLSREEPGSVWYGLAVERLFPENLLTLEERDVWQGMLEEYNSLWADIFSEEFRSRIWERDVEAVQRYFQYNAQRDAYLLSRYGSEILQRALDSFGLSVEEKS